MRIEAGKLERVDRQLLAMVEHAQDYLADNGYPISTDSILLNGFSASGNFVDRFTVLHPEEVISVTAGGLNGMPILPLEEFEGRELPYHVGIADVEELMGEAVDLDALDETNQFLYMGGEDENDTIPFNDAWTDDELRQLALDVYGDDMIDERFPNSQRAYEAAGVDAQFRVYPAAGHTPRPAVEDIVAFHRRSIRGEDVSEFGESLTAAARIEVSTTEATVGEEIEFDGSESRGVRDGEILSFQWDFDTGADATGETAKHAFEEAGTFTVTLSIVTDIGTEHETTVEVGITEDHDGQASPESESDDDADEDGETDDAGDANDDSGVDDDGFGPGFGVGAALASLGGVAHLLKRRLDTTESADQ